MVQRLDPALDQEISATLKAGYGEQVKGNWEAAEQLYLSGWSLFPEPKYDWDMSKITLYDISDFYLSWKKYDKAREWANEVFKTKVLPGDAGPHVVLGKIEYDAGNPDAAFRHFSEAYSLAGKRGFAQIDKSYLDFYLKRSKEKK